MIGLFLEKRLKESSKGAKGLRSCREVYRLQEILAWCGIIPIQ